VDRAPPLVIDLGIGARVEQREETSMTETKTERIRVLNDAFRRTGRGGRVVMTSGVQALDAANLAELAMKIVTYDEFTADNDPHGEHDFGTVEHNDQTFFWKIDYFDRAMEMRSMGRQCAIPRQPRRTSRTP
jgi:hypothetical protein